MDRYISNNHDKRYVNYLVPALPLCDNAVSHKVSLQRFKQLR